ncbi:MAG: response regulator [Myxococcota bacterium]|nr:response regulator [Myxococcota bacterium]
MKRRVLIVDDERVIREVQAEYLQGLGYEVVVAESGVQALHILNGPQAGFEVAVVDWQMAGVNGRAVFDLIRARFPETQVVISTGRTSAELSEQTVFRMGGSLLRKPFSLKTLGIEVDRQLSRN